jgi:hypothetical protein
MDADEALYGLMVVAREHQAAVSAAIEALAVERNEAAAHRNALSTHAGDLAKAAKEASADLQKAASGAARQAVVESIRATTGALCGAFGASSQPVLAQLSAVTAAAAETEARLRRTLRWLSVRWLLTVAAGAAGLVVASWFVGMASIEWRRHEITTLTDERDELTSEVARLHAQADAWAKALSSISSTGSMPTRPKRFELRQGTAYFVPSLKHRAENRAVHDPSPAGRLFHVTPLVISNENANFMNLRNVSSLHRVHAFACALLCRRNDFVKLSGTQLLTKENNEQDHDFVRADGGTLRMWRGRGRCGTGGDVSSGFRLGSAACRRAGGSSGTSCRAARGARSARSARIIADPLPGHVGRGVPRSLPRNHRNKPGDGRFAAYVYIR